MKHVLLVYLFFFTTLYSFSKDVGFKVVMKPLNANNYGSAQEMQFFTINKKGKVKPIYFSESSKMTVNVENGYLDFTQVDGSRLGADLHLCPYPQDAGDTICKLQIAFTDGKSTFNFDTSIVLNYKAPLILDYSGFSGSSGRRGRNKTVVGAILFNGGHDGEEGIAGEDGSNIVVWIKKLETNKLCVMVNNLSERDTCYYYLPHDPSRIDVFSKGGEGGKGGDGQQGRRGKNMPAGDGGKGGNGGKGGKGGSIEIVIQNDLIYVAELLNILNTGGWGGAGGKGGPGGNGKKDSNGTTYPDGAPGMPGNMGDSGENGPFPVIRFDDF